MHDQSLGRRIRPEGPATDARSATSLNAHDGTIDAIRAAIIRGSPGVAVPSLEFFARSTRPRWTQRTEERRKFN